ncbi:MAG TPA: hypothetical protein VFQ85_15400 [Mycobacteriales bacterium]|jgi:hypothetical protein|nr:hypothetical protein [Mycobacteriales bacterium]
MTRPAQRLAFVLATAVVAGTTTLTGTALADHDSCNSGHDMGAATSGTVTSAARDDWWQSTSLASRTITLQPAGGDADLYVTDASCGTVLCSSTQGGDATDSCTVAVPGTVNVRVSYYYSVSGSVPYTLTATPPPVNPVATTGYPSDDCARGVAGAHDVVSGFAGNTYVTLRTEQRADGQTWVCARADAGATSFGGKIVVGGVVPPRLVDVDAQAGACATGANYTKVADLPGVATLETANGPTGDTWVCLRAPLVSQRVIVYSAQSSGQLPVKLYLDAPGRHAPEQPASDLPSGDCQRAASGTTTRVVDLLSEGSRAYAYTNVDGLTARVCVGAPGGGLLTVTGATVPSVTPVYSWEDWAAECPQYVGAVAGTELWTGRSGDSTAVCAVRNGSLLLGERVTTGGLPAVSWQPDHPGPVVV